MKDRIDLESRARELFPASPHLQANWVRAVPKVRATQDGWRYDTADTQPKSFHIYDNKACLTEVPYA